MKNFKRILLFVLAAVAVGLAAVSCDPDEVDAFAKGYRDGYYGSSND